MQGEKVREKSGNLYKKNKKSQGTLGNFVVSNSFLTNLRILILNNHSLGKSGNFISSGDGTPCILNLAGD